MWPYASVLFIPFLFVLYLIFSPNPAKMNDSSLVASIGVGISLTATHATLSVRKPDGLYKDMRRVYGDNKYIQMMQRLSTSSARHPAPPYRSMEEFWADIPRQILRSSRKRIGLPASPDVGILSSTLNILLSKSSPLFSHDEQRSVVISYPSIIALYNEDIVDAAAHLGIIALTGQHIHQPREIVAAYAGYGMGLCESYQNREKCRQEGLEMPSRDMLLVEYTKEAMLLHSTIIREAMDLADPDISAAASFNLGSGNRHSECHTEKVKSLVLELLRKRYHWLGTPGEILVIMTGDAESVSDSAVQQAVQDAVKELGSGVSILTDMPEDVAARGAAELAWRAISLAESG